MILELLLPAVFLGGLLASNSSGIQHLRTLFRVLGATAVVGVVSVPVLLLLERNESLVAVLQAQVQAFSDLFKTTAENGPPEDSAVYAIFGDSATLARLLREILLRNYLFMYYILIAGSVWVGSALGQRTFGRRGRPLATFAVPDWMVWPLISSWSVVLLDVVFGIGAVSYLGWNIGLIMLLTYGMQGIGIIQVFLDRRRVSRGTRLLLFVTLFLMVLWPRMNLVVLIGIPALGASEIWIKFRGNQKEIDE